MGKGNRTALLYMAGILAFCVVAGGFSLFSERKSEGIKLYVKNRANGRLELQKSFIPKTGTVNEKVYWILKELVSGPVKSEYVRLLDPNIEIEEVIVRNRTVYVSFDWLLIDSLHENPGQVLNAIVQSMLMNVKELDEVKILVEGIEPISTFCGVSLQKTFTMKKL
jgi:hypothetical protein